MADPQDQDPKPAKPPKPSGPYIPGAPLPRLWKVEPEDDPEETAREARAARKAKKKAEEAAPPPKARKKGDKARDAKKKAKTGKDKDGEGKGVLLEETPEFDTYETRQKVRIAIGAALALGILLIGFVIVRFVSPPGPEEVIAQDEPMTAPAGPAGTREIAEREARLLYDRARETARAGKVDLAVSFLKKVVASYPNTQAANDARAALDHPRQNLPIFLDRPAVVATPGQPPAPPPTPPAPANVVNASKTQLATTGTGPAPANLSPPANAPEGAPAPAPGAEAPAPASPTPAPEVASKPLPKGFHAQPRIAIHPTGWPLVIVGDRDGAPMVFVLGATFIQGRDDADPSEGPAHRVHLGSYYMDQHEVTVRQFNLFQKEAGKRPDRARAIARDPAAATLDDEDDRPVVMVSAREASDYCAWAGKRLPTEAQWEAAARTPDGRIYPWGPNPPDWKDKRAPRQIDPVMSFPDDLSPYGAFDLAGNAWEWTKDWYDPRYYQQFKASPADNPTGPLNRPRSGLLVVKGAGKDWLASRREGMKTDAHLPYLGFRGVLQVEGPGNAFEPPPSSAPPPGTPAAPGGSSVPF